jgi:hypothetical protein
MTRKPIIYTADAARVDEINDGHIALIIDTDEGDKLYIDIHSVALEFYDSVQANLRPYVLEAEDARSAVAAGVSLEDYTALPQPITNRPVSVEDAIDAGYALDDPKSPGYHDRMVRLSDEWSK